MVGVMPGRASNFHKGSRAEYLAHYALSAFGTSFLVPRQEDIGIDLYCSITETIGRLDWPAMHYTVQVKSDDAPWTIRGTEAVAWLVTHPLPLFLCLVDRKELRLRLYQTSPRFHLWSLQSIPAEVSLVPEGGTKGKTFEWDRESSSFTLSAPIATFAVPELSDRSKVDSIREVLRWWCSHEQSNILRLAKGLPLASAPASYTTNEVHPPGLKLRKSSFASGMTEAQLGPVLRELEEILEHIPTYLYGNGDKVGGILGAMLLRHLKRQEIPFMELKTMRLIQRMSMEMGLSFNPERPMELLDELIDRVQQRIRARTDDDTFDS